MPSPGFPADWFEGIVEPLCRDPLTELVCARCGFTGGGKAFSSSAFVDRQIYNPELDEDPDNRPYVWDLPEGDCKCH